MIRAMQIEVIIQYTRNLHAALAWSMGATHHLSPPSKDEIASALDAIKHLEASQDRELHARTLSTALALPDDYYRRVMAQWPLLYAGEDA